MSYVEFAAASNFSFLRGASHPEELALQAQAIGFMGLGLCDRNSVAGVVRAHLIKREQNLTLRYHPGARLVFADGTLDILAYPRDRAGWGRLSRLLTRGNLRAEKGECILYFGDLVEHAEGLELIVMPECTREEEPEFLHKSRASFVDEVSASSEKTEETEKIWKTKTGIALRAYETAETRESCNFLARLKEMAPGRVRLAARMLHRGRDRAHLAARVELAREVGVPLIAVNDVLYHRPERRELQDVLTCIRNHVTIDTAGRLLPANAERHLKPPEEMARLFRDCPEAIEETRKLSAVLGFSLDELKYEYPDETREGFTSTQGALVHLAWEGAAKRYPNGIPDKIRHALDHELKLIAELRYAPYFLTVHDIVRFSRSKGILCQGRGSAANSAVCFCLGVTEVDPERVNLLFERFISTNRCEPPDIDVDFEHERREEVIQYIYERYGRDRAGIAATVISYRGRSAIRDIGKVFGLSEDTLGALSSWIWGMGGGTVREGDLARVGIDLSSPRMQKLKALIKEVRSFPRHLSQHVGGFVITRSRLDEVIPLMNGGMDKRTHVEWDKDDLDALGILKVDVLGLGMLTCIEKALRLLDKHYGEKLTIATIPPEESAVYRMLCRADSLGVFQVESRAQMTMLPRLRPEKFYDLVIEVAIVRPGPIQGNMVHPYLRRRQGIEQVTYPSDALRAVLEKTMGVPLFQEQAMKIAIVAGGFTPAEADQLRRAMATFRRVGTIGTFRDKLIKGMVERGYQHDFAERCFSQIEGFGEYGFPESHAASFALLVYASSWLKCRYPDVFAAGLLNSQPLGFYATSQIVRDAREHGVEVRPVDVNASDYDSTLEPGPRAADRLHSLHEEMREDIRATHALRLGLREIKGFSENDAKLIEQRRGDGYDSVRDLWLRTGLDPSTLTRLAEADAFRSLGLSRRDALWACQALRRTGDKDDLPLFALAEPGLHAREPDVKLPPMPPGQEVVEDYRILRLSLRQHPIEFVRDDLDRRGVIKNETLRNLPTGRRVTVGGLVLIRQRPGSANGVIFITLEDESAIANIIVWPDKFERYRPEVLGGRLLLVRGPVQNESKVIHVVAEEIVDATGLLSRLGEGPTPEAVARADEVKHGHDRIDHRMKGIRSRELEKAAAETAEYAADLVQAAPGSAHKPPRRGRMRAAHPPRLDLDEGKRAVQRSKFPLTLPARKRF